MTLILKLDLLIPNLVELLLGTKGVIKLRIMIIWNNNLFFKILDFTFWVTFNCAQGKIIKIVIAMQKMNSQLYTFCVILYEGSWNCKKATFFYKFMSSIWEIGNNLEMFEYFCYWWNVSFGTSMCFLNQI